MPNLFTHDQACHRIQSIFFNQVLSSNKSKSQILNCYKLHDIKYLPSNFFYMYTERSKKNGITINQEV